MLLLTPMPMHVAEADAVTLSVLAWIATVVCSLGGLGFYLLGRFPRYEANQTSAPSEEIEEIPMKLAEKHRLAS